MEAYALSHHEQAKKFSDISQPDSAWKLGKKAARRLTDHFTHFVKDGGSSYWRFSELRHGIALTISHYYEVENDQEVAKPGRAAMLEAYLDRGNVVAKATISDALCQYASPLTLIEQPEIAKAFIILTGIKQHELQHGGIPKMLWKWLISRSIIMVHGRLSLEDPKSNKRKL